MRYVKDITLIAVLTSILFIQKQLLSFLPNIQLTFFFLVLFSKKLNVIHTIIICLIYVILDNIIVGFNIFYVLFMFLALIIIPILLNTLFKKVESNIVLALLGVLFSFIYSWILIIPGCIVFEMDFITYLLADILWELILAFSSFITILLLYKPCAKVFDKLNIKRDFKNK